MDGFVKAALQPSSRSIKRKERRKSGNPRQAAPCSLNYSLSVNAGPILASAGINGQCRREVQHDIQSCQSVIGFARFAA